MPSEYEIHPVANIFPMMTAEEYAGLLSDMREHGQRDNGIVYDGKIIDGRNRYRACQELGIEFQYYELEPGDDPISYVVSANLHRRMLDASQRAQCAAAVANLRRGANQHTKEDRSKDLSIDDAAKAFGVSAPSVKRAKHVADKGDQSLVDAVKAGEIKVSAAAKLVDAVPDKKEQRKILKGGKKAVAAAVKKTKDKPKPKKVVEPVEPIEPDEPKADGTEPHHTDEFADRLRQWCRMQLDNLDLTPGQMATVGSKVFKEVREW